jgi:hypothetical protein
MNAKFIEHMEREMNRIANKGKDSAKDISSSQHEVEDISRYARYQISNNQIIKDLSAYLLNAPNLSQNGNQIKNETLLRIKQSQMNVPKISGANLIKYMELN